MPLRIADHEDYINHLTVERSMVLDDDLSDFDDRQDQTSREYEQLERDHEYQLDQIADQY